MAATVVYASSYFLKYPMLVPVHHNCSNDTLDSSGYFGPITGDGDGNATPPQAHPHERCIPVQPYGTLLNHRGKVWIIMSYATGKSLE